MHLTYRHLIGVYLLLYALAFSLRPDTGVSAYVGEAYGIPPRVVTGLFLACGMAALLLPVRPPWISLLCLPMLLLVVAGFLRAYNDPHIPWSGTLGHALALVGILQWAWKKSKEGGSHGTP